MEIEDLIKNDNESEKKKLFLIKKQNMCFMKKIKTIENLSDETIETIEKKAKNKREEINKISDLLFQNKKHFNQIIKNLLG
jgi:hypothetical protein